jgi:hypothetical protein
MDIDDVLDAGREALAERALTGAQLRKVLAERWPDRDATSLGYAVRYLVPLVQTTPRAVWGKRGQPTLATAGFWLEREVGTDTDPTQLILRYLRAFGPASVMDIQAWSWLTKLTPYVEALRPQLRTFRDENGKELFDVPEGMLPDADTPAPPRFLPTYDNVVLGHKDRTRIVGEPQHEWVDGKAQWDEVFLKGSILIDGFVSAGWRQEREEKGGTATVIVMPVLRRPLTPNERNDIEAEARALLGMAAPEAARYDVRFETGA